MIEFDQNQSAIANNPWWRYGAIDDRFRRLSPRPFISDLEALLHSGNNAPVLVAGPPSSGKTVLLQQLVQKILSKGASPKLVIKISLDLPCHASANLSEITAGYVSASGGDGAGGYFIILDGVHVLDNWEEQISALCDANPQWRIVCASSVAPKFINGKNQNRDIEKASGNYFSSLILPPVTFAEFIQFQNLKSKIFDAYGKLHDTEALNLAFIDYLQWGGFSDGVMGSGTARIDMAEITANSIFRGAPGVYGVSDMGELSRLYAHLVQGFTNSFSIETLAKEFAIAKNTIRKYLDYLEAAFLIRRIWRIDGKANKFSRQTRFKVYLINPSHRAALFGKVAISDPICARLAENAVISQFVHSKSLSRIFYAEWKTGNASHHVSLVEMPENGNRPVKCIEIDWSDRALALPQKILADMAAFMDQTNPETASKVLTRTIPGKRFVGDHEIGFLPVAVWCWAVGKPLTDRIG
ncbi:MAG: AAA family ATPase [Rhodospirillaceae bacterium]|nr:AAA family ATPase [Rhodospirillaceae bacterium]